MSRALRSAADCARVICVAADIVVLAACSASGGDVDSRDMKDTLTLVPSDPLPADTAFRVEFEGSISEEPTSLQWRFATGTRDL